MRDGDTLQNVADRKTEKFSGKKKINLTWHTQNVNSEHRVVLNIMHISYAVVD